MSYELDCAHESRCPCGKGLIIEKVFSNDWFQFKEELEIDCDDCKLHFHLERKYVLHGDHTVDIKYLVPNGKTLEDSEDESIKLDF